MTAVRTLEFGATLLPQICVVVDLRKVYTFLKYDCEI